MTDAGRDAILRRVEQGLRLPSPRPHWLDEPTRVGPHFHSPAGDERSLVERFRIEFEAVQGQFQEFESSDAARAWLANFFDVGSIKSVIVSDSDGLRNLVLGLADARFATPGNDSTRGWDELDCGVTTCECLVAESGSIVVSSSLSGRALSILPPLHIVVATRDQLVPDLEAAIERVRVRYGDSLPSTISCITGPSRTADIEKILVLGAHGPKRVLLVLLPRGGF